MDKKVKKHAIRLKEQKRRVASIEATRHFLFAFANKFQFKW